MIVIYSTLIRIWLRNVLLNVMFDYKFPSDYWFYYNGEVIVHILYLISVTSLAFSILKIAPPFGLT